MESSFEVSTSILPGDEEPMLEPSPWGPLLTTALMLAFAACSAALFLQ